MADCVGVDVANATCSIDGCVKKVRARGLCGAHYEAQRQANGGTRQSAPCRGCGKPIQREPGSTQIRHYCDDGCRPRCGIDGCDEPVQGRGWCVFHYTRWKLTGEPTTPLTRKSYPKGTVCAFKGCGRPRRRYEWCHIHSQQHARTGQVWEISPWTEPGACPVCGEPTGIARGFRKYCSARCQRLYYRYDGDIPESFTCVQCGGTFPFEVDGRRRINNRVTQCRRCRMDRRKHGVSVEWLARRDGTDCSICGEPVDMSAKRPDLMCPSVDHVIPRAKGGSNDPENLALAHFLCNAIKSDSGHRLGVSRVRR